MFPFGILWNEQLSFKSVMPGVLFAVRIISDEDEMTCSIVSFWQNMHIAIEEENSLKRYNDLEKRCFETKTLNK